MTGLLMAHPFFLMCTRVQYGRFYEEEALRKAYRNAFFAFRHIFKTEGIRGFYRGFVPSFIALYIPMFWNYFAWRIGE